MHVYHILYTITVKIDPKKEIIRVNFLQLFHAIDGSQNIK